VPFSLGPRISSFRHSQPLLCVHGTFLTYKYKVQILKAIALDANNHILPLALCLLRVRIVIVGYGFPIFQGWDSS
jgi:hypothetical protein